LDKPAVTTDLLLRILQRFDYYVGTTSSRAPIIMTFNTFVITGIVVKWHDMLSQFGRHGLVVVLAGVLLALVAFASLVSLRFIFLVIRPFQPARPPDVSARGARGESLFFFDDVSRVGSVDALRARADRYDEAELRADLISQLRDVAASVTDKYRYLHIATAAILYVQIPAIALLLVLQLAITVLDRG
jgi:hypothetical protein